MRLSILCLFLLALALSPNVNAGERRGWAKECAKALQPVSQQVSRGLQKELKKTPTNKNVTVYLHIAISKSKSVLAHIKQKGLDVKHLRTEKTSVRAQDGLDEYLVLNGSRTSLMTLIKELSSNTFGEWWAGLGRTSKYQTLEKEWEDDEDHYMVRFENQKAFDAAQAELKKLGVELEPMAAAGYEIWAAGVGPKNLVDALAKIPGVKKAELSESFIDTGRYASQKEASENETYLGEVSLLDGASPMGAAQTSVPKRWVLAVKLEEEDKAPKDWIDQVLTTPGVELVGDKDPILLINCPEETMRKLQEKFKFLIIEQPIRFEPLAQSGQSSAREKMNALLDELKDPSMMSSLLRMTVQNAAQGTKLEVDIFAIGGWNYKEFIKFLQKLHSSNTIELKQFAKNYDGGRNTIKIITNSSGLAQVMAYKPKKEGNFTDRVIQFADLSTGSFSRVMRKIDPLIRTKWMQMNEGDLIEVLVDTESPKDEFHSMVERHKNMGVEIVRAGHITEDPNFDPVQMQNAAKFGSFDAKVNRVHLYKMVLIEQIVSLVHYHRRFGALPPPQKQATLSEGSIWFLAVKRAERANAPADWIDQILGIEGVSLKGDRDRHILTITCSAEKAQQIKRDFPYLHVEAPIPHKPI